MIVKRNLYFCVTLFVGNRDVVSGKELLKRPLIGLFGKEIA